MSCFHPLHAFKIGVNNNGKPNYKVTGYNYNFLINPKHTDIFKPAESLLPSDYSNNIYSDPIDIPCGHCIGCYLTRSRQWADRCMLEASYHEHNCFITLTYDNDNIFNLHRVSDSIIDNDGVVVDNPFFSLEKKHLQDFIKRLRDRIKPIKVRYMACGEYGSESFRPHFHLILFGYDFPDKTLYKQNFRGDNLYNSVLLSDLWKYGYSVIAECSWDTCAYVSRYCLKKQHNDLTDFYNLYDLAPEFITMSRKPGIARQYYEDHKNDIYKFGHIFLSDLNGSKKIYPPSYFDKLYDIENPDEMAIIKDNRLYFAEQKKKFELDHTDLEYLDYLKVKEHNMSKRTAIFNERSVSYEFK